MQLEVLDFFFLFWRFIYSSFPHLLQAVTSTSTQRLNVCWICVALSSKISAVEKKKKTLASPCQLFQELRETDGDTFCSA